MWTFTHNSNSVPATAGPDPKVSVSSPIDVGPRARGREPWDVAVETALRSWSEPAGKGGRLGVRGGRVGGFGGCGVRAVGFGVCGVVVWGLWVRGSKLWGHRSMGFGVHGVTLWGLIGVP